MRLTRGEGASARQPHVPPGEASPDLNAFLWRQIKRVARFNVECLVPLVHIPHDCVDTVLGRTVRIGDKTPAQILLTMLAPPDLCIREEEALITGKAVDDWRLFSV